MTVIKEALLTRRVEKIYPNREALAALLKKQKIRLYLGIDPTGTRLHLGHTIALQKLQEFAELGHEAILLIGTGTVLIGDPSQREKDRERITEEAIKKNVATWKQQTEKILDFSKVKIRSNGKWLLKLGLKEIIEIASHISAVQLFKREMFQKRLEQKDTVWTHETLYPLLQGYDSVALDVDLEIGGTDQTFNMLIGRELQRKMNNREKFVLTVPMIPGTDGKQMSKTSDNCVWLTDSPNEMFGKLMSIPDDLIIDYFELCTEVPIEKIKDLKRKKVSDPMGVKKQLALEVTKMYHGETASKKAQEEFKNVVQKKQPPSNTPEITSEQLYRKILERYHAPASTTTISQAVATSADISTSEAVRRVEGGTISVDNLRITDPRALFDFNVPKDRVLKVGSRKHLRIRGRKSTSKKSK